MTEPKKNIARDYSQLLIISSALVTVVRYTGAFIASDLGELIGWLSTAIEIGMMITGLGMGVIDVLGGVYIFDGLRRNLPKSDGKWSFRLRMLVTVEVMLQVTGLIILVPFTLSRIRHESMVTTLGDWDWLWAIAVNIAPALIVAGTATANNIVSSGTVTNTTGQVTEKAGQKDEPQPDEKPVESDPDIVESIASDWRTAKRQLSKEQIEEIKVAETKKTAKRYKLTERQARRWRAHANKEF